MMQQDASGFEPHVQDPAALREAAEWFAILRSGRASEADRQRWQAWLGKPNSSQSLAWQRVERIAGRFEHAREPAAYVTLHSALNPRRQVLRGLFLFGSLGAAGLLATRTDTWQAWTADYRSAVGDVRNVVLADGTNVWLNTDSAMQLRYTQQRRELALVRGELYVETAPGASPFLVTTAWGEARALGTRYSVRLLGAQGAEVSVFGGAVAMTPAAASQDSLLLHAGMRGVFDRQHAVRQGPANPARRSWTRGQLLATDVTLGEFIEELSRYRHGHLACAPEVAGLKLVGSFPARDSDEALDMISRTLPVRIVRRSRWWVTLVAA